MGSEWDLVGCDPAPGNPATIASMGLDIGYTSSAAHDVQVALDAVGCDIASSGWHGDAAQAYADAFSKLPGELGLMAVSYEEVATALRTYANQLEALQTEARQSLTRAELAQQRRADADARGADASKRSADLSRQAITVSLSEKQWEAYQNLAAMTSNVVSYNHAQQQLNSIRATKRAVAQAHAVAQNDLNRARADAGQAEDSLASERGLIEGLTSDRHLAEQHTAAAIDGALATGLKNAGNFERLWQWSEKEIKDYGKFFDVGPDILSGHFQKAVADYDKYLSSINDIMHVLTDIVLGALIVAGVVVGIATLQPEVVVGAIVLGSAAEVGLGKVEVGVDIGKGVLDAELYATGYVDPGNPDTPMVTAKDLTFDVAGLSTDLVDQIVPDDATGAMKGLGLANKGASRAMDGYQFAQGAFSDQSAELRGGGGSEVTGKCVVGSP